jgi:O-antigen ligase
VLTSLFVLLVYDLFNEVEKRGEVTQARNLPRFYRVVILVLSVWFYYSIGFIKKNKFNKVFILIYVVIVFNALFDSNVSFGAIISIIKILYLLFAYLFFYQFYVHFDNKQTRKYLNYFVIFSVLVLSAYIITSRLGLIEGVMTVKVYGDNNSYILLSFLPLLYLNNLKYRKALIFILTLGVFLGLKRGAIAALIVCMLGAFVFESRGLRKKPIEKIKYVFTIILGLGFMIFIYTKFSDMFIERFEDFTSSKESIGSGRGHIYASIWRDWYESNDIKTYLFGKGYNSVLVLTKQITGRALMAHSDVFNLIHSYGFLGLLLFLWFLAYQLRMVFKLYRMKIKYVTSYFMLFIIFFFKAIYSGNFESPNFIYLLIGFAVLNAILSNLKIRV